MSIEEISNNLQKQFGEFFSKYDSNGDKEISFNEIVRALQKSGSRNPIGEANLIFQQNDSIDKDLIITPNEVKANILKLNKSNIDEAINREIDLLFGKNNKKSIGLEEMVENIVKRSNMDKDLATYSAHELFVRVDANKDKQVSVEEYREYLHKQLTSGLDKPQQ